MSHKAAAIGAIVVRGWQQPGRIDDGSSHITSRLRPRVRNSGSDDCFPTADRREESRPTGELETWADGTIFAIVFGAGVVGLSLWIALGWAIWQTFAHWT